jgi:hypothetical protein
MTRPARSRGPPSQPRLAARPGQVLSEVCGESRRRLPNQVPNRPAEPRRKQGSVSTTTITLEPTPRAPASLHSPVAQGSRALRATSGHDSRAGADDPHCCFQARHVRASRLGRHRVSLERAARRRTASAGCRNCRRKRGAPTGRSDSPCSSRAGVSDTRAETLAFRLRYTTGLAVDPVCLKGALPRRARRASA